VDWLLTMQSANGGWGSFDIDNNSRLVGQFPVCDFGEVVDPPTEDVSSHVLEALIDCGVPHGHPAIRRGIAYLKSTQRADGAWWGRWGVNYVYGTGAVLPALHACGVNMREPWVQRAAKWLRDHQNDDGGWGEDILSYADEAHAGVQRDVAPHPGEGTTTYSARPGHDQQALEVILPVAVLDEPARTLVIEPFGLRLCKGRGFPVDRQLELLEACEFCLAEELAGLAMNEAESISRACVGEGGTQGGILFQSDGIPRNGAHFAPDAVEVLQIIRGVPNGDVIQRGSETGGSAQIAVRALPL
jgi:hypothetical protein